jgi:hypothetical protein
MCTPPVIKNNTVTKCYTVWKQFMENDKAAERAIQLMDMMTNLDTDQFDETNRILKVPFTGKIKQLVR